MVTKKSGTKSNKKTTALLLIYNRTMVRKQINVSVEAYDKIKELSKDSKFKGRGITGVVDMQILGYFTTNGSGRPKGTTGIKHRHHKTPNRAKKA